MSTNNIKCAQCGLVNWASAVECKRCRGPLAPGESAANVAAQAAPEPEAPPEEVFADAQPDASVCSFCGTQGRGGFCPLCRKPFREFAPAGDEQGKGLLAALAAQKGLVCVFALLGAVVIAAAFVMLGARTGGGEASNEELAALIQGADAFKEPVAFPFVLSGSALSPGVVVLQERGLVSYQTGTTPKTFTTVITDRQTGEKRETTFEAPWGGREYARVKLTDAGVGESRNWRPYSVGEVKGWRVPIGERSFVEIKERQKLHTITGGEYARLPPGVRESIPFPEKQASLSVSFTWKWKPNALGQFFDADGEDYKTLSARAQADVHNGLFSHANAVHPGTAFFRKEKDKLILDGILFDDDKLRVDGSSAPPFRQ